MADILNTIRRVIRATADGVIRLLPLAFGSAVVLTIGSVLTYPVFGRQMLGVFALSFVMIYYFVVVGVVFWWIRDWAKQPEYYMWSDDEA